MSDRVTTSIANCIAFWLPLGMVDHPSEWTPNRKL